MTGVASLVSLSSLPQKLLAGGLGLALIGAAGFDLVQVFEKRHLASENAKLTAEIEDPKTGYVVKLSQAEANVTMVETQIAQQNVAIKTLSDQSAAAVATVQTKYDTEHAARVKAETAAAAFLAHKPQGATLVDRVNDVDAQILGDLK